MGCDSGEAAIRVFIGGVCSSFGGVFIRESSLPLQEQSDALTASYRGPKIFLECAPWWMSKQFGGLAIGLHHKEEVERYQLSLAPRTLSRT